MSIRYIAVELYRLEREVDNLRRRLETAGPDERNELEVQLARTVSERDDCRKTLDVKKEPPTYRTTFR